MELRLSSKSDPTLPTRVYNLLSSANSHLPNASRLDASALRLEADLAFMQMRGRHILACHHNGAEEDIGLVDIRMRSYRQLGARMTLAVQEVAGVKTTKLLGDNQSPIQDFLRRSGVYSLHLNVPQSTSAKIFTANTAEHRSRKVERAIRRSVAQQLVVSWVPISHLSFSLKTDLSHTEILQYVDASNRFYGTSCLDVAWFEAIQGAYSRNGTSTLFSLCHTTEGDLVGFADCHIFYPNHRTARQGNLFVYPNWRGRGVGSRLKEALVLEAFRRFEALESVATHNGADDRLMKLLSERLGYEDCFQYDKISLSVRKMGGRHGEI